MRILDVDGLFKTYDSVQAVKGVSLTIDAGEIFAFLGPNGAGKTTTIKMIAGLVEPTRGRVLVSGRDPSRDGAASRDIGAVLEGSRNIYWGLTPLENLEYFGALRGLTRRVARERGEHWLERFGLADRRNVPVRTFSRGMQQKVAIAVAILHAPRLLLLDEPTLGLDVRAAEDVKRLVREIANEGRAILLTTHQLAVAEEISDRVAVIRDGSLVLQGKMRNVLAGFSRSAHRIQFQGTLEPGQRDRLSTLPVKVDDGSVLYYGSPEGLYDVLQILRPRELVSLTPDQKSLTDIFLELTHERADA